MTPDFDARKDKTPEECHKDDGQAHSIQDPPLIITSDSHGTIPRISTAGRVDQEGRLTLVSVGSSFEYYRAKRTLCHCFVCVMMQRHILYTQMQVINMYIHY